MWRSWGDAKAGLAPAHLTFVTPPWTTAMPAAPMRARSLPAPAGGTKRRGSGITDLARAAQKRQFGTQMSQSAGGRVADHNEDLLAHRPRDQSESLGDPTSGPACDQIADLRGGHVRRDRPARIQSAQSCAALRW